MKRFVLMSAMFLSPLAAFLIIDLTILPIDWCCPSASAALTVVLNKHFSGTCYPQQHLEKTEHGDLSLSSESGPTRHVMWDIDKDGFRVASGRSSTAYPVILVGDSYTLGTGLTQTDTLAYRMSDALREPVCPDATCPLDQFMKDQALVTPMLKVLVWSPVERYIGVSAVHEPLTPHPRLQPRGLHLKGLLILDRLMKMAPLHHVQHTWRNTLYRWTCLRRHRLDAAQIVPVGRWAVDHSMVFLDEELGLVPMARQNPEDVGTALGTIKTYWEKRGVALIFAPIPNKSTVYFARVPWQTRPTYFEAVIDAARRHGVNTVDILPAFDALANRSVGQLYQIDDTHWGPLGARIMAEALSHVVAKAQAEDSKKDVSQRGSTFQR